MSRSMPRGQLQSKNYWANVVIEFYYDHLNADPDFRAALTELFQECARAGWLTSATPENKNIITHLFASSNYFEDVLYPFQATHTGPRWDVHNALGAAMSAFCERWHLPTQYGLGDLSWSLELALIDEQAMLVTGGRTESVPQVGIPVLQEPVQIGSDTRNVYFLEPWVSPPKLRPFQYDPTYHNRDWLHEQLDRLCTEVRQSILSQADKLERAVAAKSDWRVKTAGTSEEYLRRVAHALYLRAVKREKWSDVMSEFDSDLQDAERFADRIRRRARKCGIPL